MRAVIVWREHSDYGREVEDWLRDFQMRTGKTVETVDPDSLSGESFARAYDIVVYPTILGLDDSGKILDMWRGVPLPRIDEVSYYAAEQRGEE